MSGVALSLLILAIIGYTARILLSRKGDTKPKGTVKWYE